MTLDASSRRNGKQENEVDEDCLGLRWKCFQTIDGRRYFVVSATTPKGKPFERKIEMPATKVTEQDVVMFLHDAGLSHLYRTGDG